MTALGESAEAVQVSAAASLRRLAGPVYLPAAIYAVGQGAVTPVIAIGAHQLGASLAVSGLIAGLPTVGVLIGDAPSGAFVARVGEKVGMIVSAAVTFTASIVVVLANSLPVLTVAALVMGAASSVFLLARHSLLTDLIEPRYRARALSLLAGTYRLGVTIGPFTTAALISHFGPLSAYGVESVTDVLVILYLLVAAEPEHELAANPVERSDDAPAEGLGPLLKANAPMLLRVGSGMAILQLLRSSMMIIIPLWGIAIHMPPSRIALAVGMYGLLQLVLFYAAGQIADRFGRMWVAMPVVTGIALGHLLLVLAHSTVPYFAVVAVLALANGFGGGIMMTLGSDLAPPGRTSEFLGLWRLFNDAGGASAPFIIAGGTLAVSLGTAVLFLGGLGFVGSWMLWRYIPRYVDGSLV